MIFTSATQFKMSRIRGVVSGLKDNVMYYLRARIIIATIATEGFACFNTL